MYVLTLLVSERLLMRSGFLIAAIAVMPLMAASSAVAGIPTVTVVMSFEQQRYSDVAVRTMQSEAGAILRESGLQLDWALEKDSAGRQDFGELVVFRMRGRCIMDRYPPVPDELGLPLAITHSSDGEILSFGEVNCDRVRQVIRKALVDYSKGDAVFGRALGRVVAHELYHMLTRSKEHAADGVTRTCFTGRDLTRERLGLSERSLSAIREQIGLMKSRQNSARQTSPDQTVPSFASLP